MKKLLLTGILLVLLFVTVNAVTGFDVISPEHYEEIMDETIHEVEVQADEGYSFDSIILKRRCAVWNPYIEVVSETFDEPTSNYTYDLDMTPFEPGRCYISISPVVITPEGELSPQQFSRAITVIPYEEPEEDVAVQVLREFPDEVSPGGLHWFNLNVFPNSEFTGIVLRETLPDGIEIDLDALESDEIDATAESTYDEETRLLRFVLFNTDQIPGGSITVWYTVDADIELESTLEFSGEWEVLGETGPIEGTQELEISGMVMPECPLTDTQLLEYIDQWANNELSTNEALNDMLILQILEVWKNC
ncbi:MAG: hypothetical protein ABH821_03605 [archaeon]